MASFVSVDVAWPFLLGLATVFTLPSFFSPLQVVVNTRAFGEKQVPAGKLALLFRMVSLPWMSGTLWYVSAYFTNSVQNLVNADASLAGVPVYVLTALLAVFGTVMIVYGMAQVWLWLEFPDEENGGLP